MPATMTRQELLDKVRNNVPALGWDSKYPNLFGKYGTTVCGIGDGWHWFEENNITDIARSHGYLPLSDASDDELMEMLAMAQDYWLHKYEEWFDRSDKKAKRLDTFVGQCERKFFGYDKDGYTLATIDRILGQVMDVLDKNKTNF